MWNYKGSSVGKGWFLFGEIFSKCVFGFYNLRDVDEVVRQSQVKEVKSDGQDIVVAGCSDWSDEKYKEVCARKKTKKREYKLPKFDGIINNFSKKQFAPQSKWKIKWVVNLYDDWRQNRIVSTWPCMQIVRADINKVNELYKDDLSFALSRFVREVKKINGEDYPPNMVRELVIMIQTHLHENGLYWHLLEHAELVNLWNVVDNTMKERHAMGLGVKKSACVISLEHENKLFESGQLGDDEPLKLLRTVMYMIGMHCALRGGVEHNNLRRPGFSPQINVEVDERGVERLVYCEDPLQKTNQGGLICKGMSKKVFVYAASDPRRCPIRIYKKYIGLLPQSRNCRKLYLRVKKRIVPNNWYCDEPYGVNKIKSTVKDICSNIGVEGKFTNQNIWVRNYWNKPVIHCQILHKIVKKCSWKRVKRK